MTVLLEDAALSSPNGRSSTSACWGTLHLNALVDESLLELSMAVLEEASYEGSKCHIASGIAVYLDVPSTTFTLSMHEILALHSCEVISSSPFSGSSVSPGFISY